MIKIRYHRLAKFKKKNQKLKLATQIVAIWYTAFISISYLTTNTEAYFNANHQVSINIQAGFWVESKLSFTKKGNDNLNEFICPVNAFEISTVIKNVGTTDMSSDGSYEVYFIKKGQPSEHDTKVAEGKIAKLLAGQEIILTQKVTSEGVYMFKTFEDNGQNKEKVIWSEKIKVKCKTSNSPETAGGGQVNPVTPIDNDESKVEDKVKEETKTEPEVKPENLDTNSSNQNNTVSEKINTDKVTEEE